MKGLAGYVGYRLFSGLFGLLPEPVVRRIGYGLGWASSFVARKRFPMAVRHQRRVQGEGVDARRAARKVFGFYGRYWAETFWVRPRRRAGILVRTHVEGIERLHAAVARGRGVILALPHVGNWEVAGLRASDEDIRVLAVAEELGNERIVQWFIDQRNMMEIDIVIARKGSRVTRQLLKRLGEGGVVALVCDRDIKGAGVEVEFFGERTTLPAGPAALADRTGAVILPVGTFFGPGARYDFEVRAPLPVSPGPDSEARVQATTQALAAVLEDIVSRRPEQWHLVQPNWPSDAA
ncbi:MAG: phosphatidylinositol mannoside acyltransferase [Acidimicrobiia bacterium]